MSRSEISVTIIFFATILLAIGFILSTRISRISILVLVFLLIALTFINLVKFTSNKKTEKDN